MGALSRSSKKRSGLLQRQTSGIFIQVVFLFFDNRSRIPFIEKKFWFVVFSFVGLGRQGKNSQMWIRCLVWWVSAVLLVLVSASPRSWTKTKKSTYDGNKFFLFLFLHNKNYQTIFDLMLIQLFFETIEFAKLCRATERMFFSWTYQVQYCNYF